MKIKSGKTILYAIKFQDRITNFLYLKNWTRNFKRMLNYKNLMKYLTEITREQCATIIDVIFIRMKRKNQDNIYKN